MKEMTVTEARSRLSNVVDDAIDGRPTVITHRGRRVAVIVSFDEWSARTTAYRQFAASPIDTAKDPDGDGPSA